MKSMTGYGISAVSSDGIELTLEIKTVNHRFLDINLHYPRALLYAEDTIRNEIGKYISRGHAEVNISYKNTRDGSKTVEVDCDLARQYINAFNRIMALGIERGYSVSDIAKMPDVISVSVNDDVNDTVLSLAREAVKDACAALNETRRAEGEKIGADLSVKLDNILEFRDKVEALSANNFNEVSEKLRKRLDDILKDNRLDEQRIAQEIAVYADKLAIDEELVRIKTHVKNMRDYMLGEGEIGKKLDFYIQELNREFNTIGSKSCNADVAKAVVAAKNEIEKLREQIQNIE